MIEREAALKIIKKVADENATKYFAYGRGSAPAMRRINTFSDDTLIKLAAGLTDPIHGQIITIRAFLLIDTGQQKRLEGTVRNILTFSAMEKPYLKEMTVHSKPWKTVHSLERYARIRVCGTMNVIETPEQEARMVAMMHALFAVAMNYMNVNKINYYMADYGCKQVTHRINKGNLSGHGYESDLTGVYELLDHFADHPENAERYAGFVITQGIVDPELLDTSLTTSSALYQGIL